VTGREPARRVEQLGARLGRERAAVEHGLDRVVVGARRVDSSAQQTPIGRGCAPSECRSNPSRAPRRGTRSRQHHPRSAGVSVRPRSASAWRRTAPRRGSS
jgi:hypothetical protein